MNSAVEKHIRFLLHLHDCVIIPGFGALITGYKPAFTDQNRGLLMPPSRELSFNSALKRNDGLLADHIASATSTPYSTALDQVKEYVRTLNAEITEKKRYRFDEVGDFVLDREGKISFEPSREENYLAESYGLGPVGILQNNHRRNTDKRLTRRLKPALVALPVLAVVAAVSLLGYNDSGFRQELSSVLPSFGNHHIEYRERYPFIAEVTDIKSAELLPSSRNESVRFLDISDDDNAFLWPVHAAKTPVDNISASTIKNSRDINASFYIVAGCFSSERNARKQVEMLRNRGVNANIAGVINGLHRVTAGEFISREEAANGLRDIRQDICPDAWLWNNQD